MQGQVSTGWRQLPRLVYISDVPLESHMHGSLLMYRLLQRYPAERLRVLEVLAVSNRSRRLADVSYSSVGTLVGRARSTRFSAFVDTFCLPPLLSCPWPLDVFWPGFKPQAVLTVGHGAGCLVASRYALNRRLPLHLVAHDDVRRFLPTSASRNWTERKFAAAYQYASSRLCVSPKLEQVYCERYGVSGSVLYPASGDDTPVFETPSEGPGLGQPFTIAFAGNVFSLGQLQLLVKASEMLARMGGKLLLFGPHERSRLEAAGMNLAVTVLRGTLKSVDLIEVMRLEAHALLLPWTFEPNEVVELSLSFPSKLTDYMATGLPILVWGPRDNPVDAWMKEVPETMVGITDALPESFLQALASLAGDKGRRLKFGQRSLAAGKRFFSPDVAARKFEAALTG